MSIEVKCNCGKSVFARPDQAGQNLQCPHCKGVVPIPTGVAAATTPTRLDKQKADRDAAIGQLIASVVALVVLWFAWGALPELSGVFGFLALGGVVSIGHALTRLGGG